MKAEYMVYETYFGEWACVFYAGGAPNPDVRGSYGTGLKLYANKEKAVAAGERYLKKMHKNGFEI